MQIFLAFISFSMLASCFLRYRSFYHPVNVLCLILFVMFYSDFLVRGYSDNSIRAIPDQLIMDYQFIIVLITIISMLVVNAVSKQVDGPKISLFKSIYVPSALIYVAMTIFLLELYKRMSSVDFSIVEVFEYSFGPRSIRPWAQDGPFGDERFVGSLIGILFPFSVVVLGVLWNFSKSPFMKLVSIFFWIIGCIILFGNGSRTFLAVAVILPFLLKLIVSRTLVSKAIALSMFVGGIILTAYLFSVMVTHRSAGFLDLTASSVELVYHQDNSYYLAIWAAYLADTAEYRWDSIKFFASSFLNFIPRAVWSGKPVLDQDFYGDFKVTYVTTTFIGEAFAMFGLFFGTIISIVFILIAYFILRYFSRRVVDTYSLLVYFLMCFYVYMVFRSLLNISMGIYIPIAAVITLILLRRLSNIRVLQTRISN